ncbi:uncharacterized protein METZ01_LOCUS207574 [marine metagenome]|uniref:Glycosyl hydrolase family 32 N-terminal domain-containing protein n=1 Tax=marine metagenome TaxID=408172 RepID=A0A382EVF4_9ZZZZ
MRRNLPRFRLAAFLGVTFLCVGAMGEPPAKIKPWLTSEQEWQRDTDKQIIALGKRGAFDDTHIFAPMVAHEKGAFQLWYCGSTGRVAERVFHMGLATSGDGRLFKKHADNPVYHYGDGKHSVLTPALLRNPDGTTLRENGRLRMWFSSTWFAGGNGLHTLHEATSADGLRWSLSSPSLLKHVYSPTVIKTGDTFQMWYTDVSVGQWQFRHATSRDGSKWTVTKEPILKIDQPWESKRLFYPHVIKLNGVYLMWYGSYWTSRGNTTALGLAASLDGKTWHKHPSNPVFTPDPERLWESHYTTSHCVMRLPDGSLRLWYASRKAPPFTNKYFAINTAVWKNPPHVR